jgi:hypothetical protein
MTKTKREKVAERIERELCGMSAFDAVGILEAVKFEIASELMDKMKEDKQTK